MNKTIISTIGLGIFLTLQIIFVPAQPSIKTDPFIKVSNEVIDNLNFKNSLEGSYWTGQGVGDDEVYIFELKFKPKGKVTYILAEYGLKDKTFNGTYTQKENSFVISFTGKSRWKIEGKIDGEKIICNRISKNSAIKEYVFEKRHKN